MEVIYLLMAVSATIALGFLIAFIWATRTNQYKDTYTPSIRMLFDENKINRDSNEEKN